MLAKRLLGRVDQGLGVVFGLDLRLTLLVFLGMGFRVFHHALDISIGKAARRLDTDLLLLAGALVPGVHIHDAVGIDVERHLDLRHAARGRRNSDQIELPKHLVIRRHFTFALENPDGHGALIVLGGREDLTLLGWNGGVSVDQSGENTAQRLDAERKRSDVEQQHVLDVALEHARLDSRAHRDHLVGIDALVRLLPEQLLHDLLHSWHPGHAADQDHLVDLGRGETCILERQPTGLDGLLHKVVHERLELCPGKFHREVLGT